MSPNELKVLRIFVERAGTAGIGKGETSKRLGISTDYAVYLCKSLFRKGYLETMPKGQYQLTREGLTALLEHLSQIWDGFKQKMILLDELMEMTRLKLAKLRKMEGTFQE